MASNLIFTLFTLGYFGLIIFLALKRKMHLAAFFLLAKMALSSLLIGLIMTFSLPPGHEVSGNAKPYIPILVALLIIIMAVLSLRSIRKESELSVIRSVLIGWILFALGFIVQLSGLSFALMSIFTPHIYGSVNPVPEIGVPGFLGFTLIACLMFYLSSKRNTSARPNLLRWIVFFSILMIYDQVTITSLLLIFSVPSQPPTTYPQLASINTLSYLPFAFAIFQLAKDYIRKPSA